MVERDRETGEKGGKMTPEEIIKTFEMVWALPEDKAKLALFGLIMVHESGGKLNIKNCLAGRNQDGTRESKSDS